jgi:TolB-like protein
MNVKILILISAITLLISSLLYAEDTGKPAKSKLQTVAVLEFENTSGSKNYDYLNKSIPEAVITSIARLKRFKVLERKALEAKLEQMQIDSTGLTEDKAKKAAKLLKADIYITGSFLAVKDHVQINGRIFNAHTGELLGAAKKKGKVSHKIFDMLDEFSEELAVSLDEAVPKEKVVTKIVYRERELGYKFEVYAAPLFVSPVGSIGDTFDSSFGFEIGVGINNLFFRRLYFGLDSGFSSVPSSYKEIDSLSIIPFYISAGYNFYLFKDLTIRPYLLGGINAGSYKSQYNEVSYNMGSFGAGVFISFPVWKNLSVYVNEKLSSQMDDDISIFNNISLGVKVNL